MTSFAGLLIGLGGIWFLGLAVAHRLLCGGRDRMLTDDENVLSEPTWTELVGLGWMLGIGLTAALLFGWSWCGGRLIPAVTCGIAMLGYVAGIWVWWRERRRANTFHSTLSRNGTRAEGWETNWVRFCQAMIAGLFVLTLGEALLNRQNLWDERASFALKGLVLWYDQSIHSLELADPNFVQYHPRYPLLIPLAELAIYDLLGDVDDRWSKVVFPLLYLSLVLTVAGVLERMLTRPAAWFYALLLASVPSLTPYVYGFPCGQGDAPTACYHGVAVLYLWLAWQQFQCGAQSAAYRAAALSGVCAALAAWTKDEGISYLMVDALAMALVTGGSRQWSMGLRVTLVTFGLAALLLLPWFLHRRTLPMTTEANYFGRLSLDVILNNYQNLNWEVPHLLRRMFWEWREWGLQWWLLVFALIAAPKRLGSSASWILLLDLIGSVCCLLLAGVLADIDVQDHVGGSSHRYLMQLVPVAVLFAASQLGASRGSFANRPPTPDPGNGT